VPLEDYTVPLGLAEVKRAGRDVTMVAFSTMVHVALRAADALASMGIEAEVVDVRSLVPLDVDTIVSSVKRTSRVLVLDQACTSYGASAEIAAIIGREAFDYLDAPVVRLAALDVPIPYSRALEPLLYPDEQRVSQAVRDLLRNRT
jgi:pyruvate/2-oxoglutarate/acetoin dehydrogenase E1 component